MGRPAASPVPNPLLGILWVTWPVQLRRPMFDAWLAGQAASQTRWACLRRCERAWRAVACLATCDHAEGH